MPAVYPVELACKIVKEHFGKPAEVVLRCLLQKGRQSFAELLRNCNNLSTRSNHSTSNIAAPQQITPSTLKQVLLVLVQQNCIETHLQPAEVLVTGIRPAVYLYEALLNSILQILRLPKFLQYIREDIPEHAGNNADVSSLIIEVLAEHGRLRYDQVTNAVVAKITQDTPASAGAAAAAAAATASDDNPQNGQPTNDQQPQLDEAKLAEYKEAVRWSFVQLLQEHYIERAPPCNLPPVGVVSKAPTRAKKAAPKPGSAEYAEQQSRTMRELAHKSHAEQRFKAPRELIADSGMNVEDILTGVTGNTADGADGTSEITPAKPSRKRKKIAGGVTADAAAAATAAAAAAAAAESKALKQQAAALASKKRKTNSKAAVPTGAAADESRDREMSPEVKVKREDGDVQLAAGTAAAAGVTGGSSRAAGSSCNASVGGDEVDPPNAAELLWRLNPDEFNRRFRNKVMVKLVGEKLGKDMGAVLAAMLSHGRRFEHSVKGDQGVTMSAQDVCQALKAGQDAGRLPELAEGADVPALLEALSYDSLNSVSKDMDNPAGVTYCVNMAPILFRAKVLQLQAVLRDKFGQHGLRVYQTLLYKGQLEQKQVAEQAMQPQKETRELLYRMFKAGYVHMQDIPRTADRAPSRCFYTWGVDLERSFTRLGDDLYQAAANLHSRLTYEMEQQAELVELVEAARAAGALNFNVTDGQRCTLERLARVTGALATSLLRLDDMIALFHEY